MKIHPVIFMAAVMFTLPGCMSTPCEELALSGEEAKKAIAEHEQLVPETFITVPDTMLYTGTREVEGLLNELKERGLLTYSLEDSSQGQRNLARKSADTARAAVFYNYRLRWSPALDAYEVKTGKVQEVVSFKLMGREYTAECRYRARHLLVGKITIDDQDSLYFRQNCGQIVYKCTYTADSLHALGAVAGMPPLVKTTRAVTIALGH